MDVSAMLVAMTTFLLSYCDDQFIGCRGFARRGIQDWCPVTGYGRQRMDMQVTPRNQLQVWNKHEGGKREQPEEVRGGLRRLEELRNWLYEALDPQTCTTSQGH
jgi:hypothetical protein